MIVMTNAWLHSGSVLRLLINLLLVLFYSTRIVVKSSVCLFSGSELATIRTSAACCTLIVLSSFRTPASGLATADLHRVLLVQQLRMVLSVVLFSWSWSVAMIRVSNACLHSGSVSGF